MALKNTYSGANNSFEKIQRILAENGAKKVMFDFDGAGKVEALSFQIEINNQPISFRLPAMVDNVTQIMFGGRKRGGHKWGSVLEITNVQKEQAYKTAWANIRDWLDAQMALVKTRQVEVLQVFLPYAVTKNNKTLYENVIESPSMLLGDGN